MARCSATFTKRNPEIQPQAEVFFQLDSVDIRLRMVRLVVICCIRVYKCALNTISTTFPWLSSDTPSSANEERTSHTGHFLTSGKAIRRELRQFSSCDFHCPHPR